MTDRMILEPFIQIISNNFHFIISTGDQWLLITKNVSWAMPIQRLTLKKQITLEMIKTL